MWLVQTADVFDEWFADRDDDAQVEVIGTVKLLGPRLGRPLADTLNGSKYANMKELRATTAEMVLRIAFAFDPDRSGILLVGGDKSGVSKKRFYQQQIEKGTTCTRHTWPH